MPNPSSVRALVDEARAHLSVKPVDRSCHVSWSLIDRLAAALEAQEWCFDMEKAPKDGTAIWLLLDNQPCIGYCEPSDGILRKTNTWFVKATFRRGDRERGLPDEIFGTYAFGVQPEAWMPLPPAPTPEPPGEGETK